MPQRGVTQQKLLLSVGAVAALLVVLRLVLGPPLFGPRCEEGATRAGKLWSAEARAQTERRFKASGSENASAAWTQAKATLDAWAQRWEKTWRTSCEDGTQADARARAALCLDQRLSDFEVVVGLFGEADDGVVDGAPLAFSRLYGPEACLRGEAVATAPLPDGPAARLTLTRSRLLAAQSDSARLSGRHASAMKLAKESVALAKNSGWRPAEADALLALAEEQRARGDFAEGAKTLDEALIAAEAGHAFEAVVRIAVQQVFSLGTQAQKPEEAEAWLTRARGALVQLPRPELEAEVQLATAFLRVAQGLPEEGVEPAAQAAEAFARLGRPVRALDAKSVEAQALAQCGRGTEAVPLGQEVLTGRVELLGGRHPLTIRAALDLGVFLGAAGDLDAAVAALAPALRTAEISGIAELTSLLAADAMGSALSAAGRHKEGLGVHRSVLRGVERVLGANHRQTAIAHDALAAALRDSGDLKAAREEHAIALRAWASSPGGTEDQRAVSHAAFAWTLAQAGEADLAIEEAGLALAKDPVAQRTFAWVVPVTTARAARAMAMLQNKASAADARDEAAQAVSTSEKAGGPQAAIARARALLTLGEALTATGVSAVEPWRRALTELRAVNARLAPGLQTRLLCRLGEDPAQLTGCDDARECERLAATLEVGTTWWGVGEHAPAAVVKRACK